VEEVTNKDSTGTGSAGDKVSVLIDVDNAFPRPISTAEEMAAATNRILDVALVACPLASFVEVRLYGGWLEDGVLTRYASTLQSALGGSNPVFPIPHPNRTGLLRGSLELVTRLAELPHLEWRHTLRRRSGLPRVTLADRPYPKGCIHESSACPIKALQKLARRPNRQCHEIGCHVTNTGAFKVPEQKMVDVMLACDIFHAGANASSVVVVSSDMDLLPAVAVMSARLGGRVALARGAGDSALVHEEDLAALGTRLLDWPA